MALFSKLLIRDYNILPQEQGKVMLQCDMNADIHAPFDAKVVKNDNSCELQYGDFVLYIDNIDVTCGNKVKAGNIIGCAQAGRNTCYVDAYLTKNDELEDIIKYLRLQDGTVIEKPKAKVVKDETKTCDTADRPEASQTETTSKTSKKKTPTKE